jgi:hypothetical protein
LKLKASNLRRQITRFLKRIEELQNQCGVISAKEHTATTTHYTESFFANKEI